MEIHKQIYIYPVKSLRPYPVESAVIGPYGFVHDRTFMLLKIHRDADATVARLENMHIAHFPRMALFLTFLELEDKAESPQPGNVIVTFVSPNTPPPEKLHWTGSENQIRFPLRPSVEARDCVVLSMHNSPTTAYNMGEPYNSWFSERFEQEVILAFLGDNSRAVLGSLSPNSHLPSPQPATSSVFTTLRSLLPSSTSTSTASEATHEDRIAFQDCAQFLVITEESLADVSARLPAGSPPMDGSKFRPNIVLSGSPDAWAEDYWAELSIVTAGSSAECIIALTANCVRCKSINVDYATGAPGTDESGSVLKKLQKDRRVDAGVKYSPCFGRYGFCRKVDVGKRVAVGDRVVVTRRNAERTKFDWPRLASS